MKLHEKYMKRCLDLALNGLGQAQPNPLVGCVITYNNTIIGEGYHKKYGESHAEVNAVKSVKNKDLLKKSRLYVNLEPCAHYGKTPPCAEMIVQNKIPEVVIGTIDPFALVKGKGVEILKKGGCKVTVGVLKDKCEEINKRFFTYHNKKRPYIILKWAETKDGYIDIIREKNHTDRPTWITDETCRSLVHKWRAEEQAILIGKNTALIDNPILNIRNWTGKNPVRVVIDKNLSLPENLSLFDNKQKTLVFNNLRDYKKADNIFLIKLDFSQNIISQILESLYNLEIQSVIVEGGAKTLQSFIDLGYWDEARVFTGNIEFKSGVKAPKINTNTAVEENIGNSRLKLYLNRI
ncbi:MAG: bifunctional diaminohydroxyphosphoribosylaminopyrimidine deaminase/5-amino-6-(5-phosphoribosylamino)uracil reductase RibD [Marinilabiliales bacterium]